MKGKVSTFVQDLKEVARYCPTMMLLRVKSANHSNLRKAMAWEATVFRHKGLSFSNVDANFTLASQLRFTSEFECKAPGATLVPQLNGQLVIPAPFKDITIHPTYPKQFKIGTMIIVGDDMVVEFFSKHFLPMEFACALHSLPLHPKTLEGYRLVLFEMLKKIINNGLVSGFEDVASRKAKIHGYRALQALLSYFCFNEVDQEKLGSLAKLLDLEQLDELNAMFKVITDGFEANVIENQMNNLDSMSSDAENQIPSIQ